MGLLIDGLITGATGRGGMGGWKGGLDASPRVQKHAGWRRWVSGW